MSASNDTVLGISFYNKPLNKAVEEILKGGLACFPSAPGLAELKTNKNYRRAIKESDFTLVDSGFLSLLVKLLMRKNLVRISGYRFLKECIKHPKLQEPHHTFWVMPSEQAVKVNKEWLLAQEIQTTEQDTYVAPIYDRDEEVQDKILLNILNLRQPPIIIICIGGGPQEQLGHFLQTNLNYKPTILCTGAAIAFLNGSQAKIPIWADRLYLGWLFRILQSPKSFTLRYLKAFRLSTLVFRYQDQSPV